ncbi:sigma-70 family RNA polymerase sigma factor [Gemmatimonas sp.]|uniref:sigma-70 family RNA polymerase sigma factor n=1 Tax=Gemmatimonas sp. TaxID=1962908 RepID=UPI0025C12FFB|nr:sigma-70 family RNA polymerase sigma factor [Gemmatimonas sp.]
MEPTGFRALFLAEYDRLCRYARREGATREEAEELVQDVFARLWETPASLERAGSPTAFLHAAVRHALLNRARHRRTVARLHDQARGDARSPGVSMDTAVAPDVLVERRALADAVQAALASLPARGREALQLQRHGGLSYSEIAEVMAVSPSTVKTHIARALAALRDQLAPWRDRADGRTAPEASRTMSADLPVRGPSSHAPRLADSVHHVRPRAHRP